MSSKAFSFCIDSSKSTRVDAIVAEAIRITPEAQHFVPKWYRLCSDGIIYMCDATPNEVRCLLDDLSIFSTGDSSIKWLIVDIANSYIADVASHAFD